ncbi:DUF421 domain-containing protein [Flavobacterium sp. 14A]|uniref:DUF421 domain-containing protein n=1 Tax=Flavobacterium sp. 14A TaxID=2735896 RepID=UPI00156F46E1|nr:YetF domain-containing protein [Flavobacterium sp. 14A]NRT12065.1 uncharacterized membrane protein YcaP (DUF421 family) [Flavobacterium sp. 14A]
MKDIFDWSRVLWNDLPEIFLVEVVFRSVVMFVVLLLTLKIAGKRGVKQLSVFETVIIIALGSAAGDPMLYDNVGILPAITVFAVIILLYRLITWIAAKNKKFETFIEGKTECFINEGRFSIKNFKKESLAQDEFFSELRLKSIEHLGQIKNAYIETSGEISTFFYKDEEVVFGLPILPHLFDKKQKHIPTNAHYSCTFCGFTEHKSIGTAVCEQCQREEWVPSINTTRIT